MKNILFAIGLLSFFNGHGQITPDKVRGVLMHELTVQSQRLGNEKLVAAFYESTNYRLTWIGSEDKELGAELFTLLASAENYGMDHREYRHSLVQSLSTGWMPGSTLDTILTDFKLTDAALQFLCDLKNGESPRLSYKGFDFDPGNLPIARLLANYCSNGSLKDIVDKIEPTSKEYRNAKKLLLHFNQILHENGFSEVTIKSNKVEISNLPLVTKLYQLGVADSISISDPKLLVQKLKKAQKMLDVLSDGVLRTTSIAALNIPVWIRREEVKAAMKNIRWFESARQHTSLGILNIPSARLFVYISDTLALHSRIVAGKPSTPTPTLSSRISEVIVYPYWHVPYKIATRELLPSIKRNTGFLEANNFQVLNKQGKIVDPYKINWQSLSTSYFPYTIRQSTGCDNALGVLKFNFYNPFSVYLHDTPGKGLFYLNRRYFSHGCMRIEEAVALAGILLKGKAKDIDSLANKCLKDQSPKTIPLTQHLPLVVFYSTAWYNELGEIQFYEDIYRKNSFEKPAIAMN